MLVLLVAATVAFVALRFRGADVVLDTDSNVESLPAYVQVEHDGMRFEFDALTGRERYSRASDPGATVAPSDAERTHLKALLEAEIGTTLDALRATHRATAEELRRLGYL